MSTQTAPKDKDTRLHLRASPSQKELLARAAKTRHLNLTQFVLQACLEAAEKVVREQEVREQEMHEREAREQEAREATQGVIRVSAQHHDWLMQKLDEPPQDNPALRALLAESPRWKD